jgi:hypothetical protein
MNQVNLLQLLLDAANAKGVTVPSKPTTLEEFGKAFQLTFTAQPGMADAETSQIERFVYNNPDLPVIDIRMVVEKPIAPDDPTIIFVRLADNIIIDNNIQVNEDKDPPYNISVADQMKRMAEAQFRIDVSNYLVQRHKSGRSYKLNPPSYFGYLVRFDRGIFTKLKLGDATANDFDITPLAF